MQSLSGLICQPWFSQPRFSFLHDNVEKLRGNAFVCSVPGFHNQKVQYKPNTIHALQYGYLTTSLSSAPSLPGQELFKNNTANLKLFQACLCTNQSVSVTSLQLKAIVRNVGFQALLSPTQSRSTAIHMGMNLEQFRSSAKSVSQRMRPHWLRYSQWAQRRWRYMLHVQWSSSSCPSTLVLHIRQR